VKQKRQTILKKDSVLFDGFQCANSQAIGNLNQVVGYGSTGCGVFKGGIQNQKSFWQKINCS
jgi:hypothetical protein